MVVYNPPSLSGYWKTDGSSSPATGNWNLGTKDLTNIGSTYTQHFRLYDNVMGQYGIVDLSNETFTFKSWDGDYQYLTGKGFTANQAGLGWFIGGTADTITYPLTGGYFSYIHNNANYDTFQFLSRDVNNEFGGDLNVSANVEESFNISQGGIYFTLNAGGVALSTTMGVGVSVGTTGTQLYLAPGSVSQPSLSFQGDTNTGIYGISGDTIGIVTGGVAQLLIGNASIASSLPMTIATSTTSPIFAGGGGVNSQVKVRSTTGNGTTDAIIFQTGNNGATEAGRITTAGRWGIGTTTPSTTFVLSAQTTTQTAVTGALAQFVGLDANPLRVNFDTHNNASTSGTALMFRRSRGTATTPAADVVDDVLGSLNARGYGTSQYAAGSTGLISFKAEGTFTNTSNPTAITFDTTPNASVTATEKVRITGAGDVGIGTTSPSARLHAISTTEQQRLGYDASNYYKTTVSSTGGVTFDATGTGASFTFVDKITNQSGENHATRVVTAAGAVTIATTDLNVIVNKTVGAATVVNLPASPATGDTYTIKDGKGDAATNNITLTPNAGNIDGAGTFVMNINYQSITIVYNGTQWNLI